MKQISLVEIKGACLDLRSERDFAAGHLPGAVNIPFEELRLRMHELPPRGERLLLYGARAEEAARFLAQKPRWEISWCDERLPTEGLSHEPGQPLWRPHPWLMKHYRHIPAGGRVFDVAMGTGRDAVFLAKHGFEVSGEDILPEAVTKAKDLAARNGVQVDARVGDLTRSDPLPPESADGIVVFNYLDRELFRNLEAALRPGGVVIYETFMRGQELRGKPSRPEHLLQPGELAEAFRNLDVLEYGEGENGSGSLTARILARR